MYICRLLSLCGVFILAVALASEGADAALDLSEVVPVGMFSEMSSSQGGPGGWKPVSLADVYKKTAYELVQTERGTAVRARSRNSSSALSTPVDIDPATHPVLEWHWKIRSIVEEGRMGLKERDDFPASVIVSFEYKALSLSNRLRIVAYRALGYDFVPRRALIYLWANRTPRGTVTAWPYGDWLKMVSVRSDTAHVGEWMFERRNVQTDYRRIFGEEPPPIGGVGIMTHTDNTDGSTTAYYGDIVFRSAVPDSVAVDTTLHVPSSARR